MRQPKIITSLTNDRIKAIRALDMRKTRKETGQYVVEGLSLLITAREHGVNPQTLVYLAGSANEGLARGMVATALEAGAEVLEVSRDVLAKLSSKDNPQTMLGVFDQQWAAAPKPNAIRRDVTWLALDEIRDPGNLGTIIRTADATGIEGIILAGACCDPYAHECVRATMGSIFAVPLVRMPRDQLVALIGNWPGETVGTHLVTPHDFRKVRYRSPVMVVMGSEGPGLSEVVAKACRRLVKIPMAGRLDSLNLAVATALMLYQVRGDTLNLKDPSS
jgi:TrmH family RNA methyltransferase